MTQDQQNGATREVAVSVVIPMKDESANVQTLIEEITAAFPETSSFEIICVDDGSTDDTWDKLEAMHAGCPQLRCLAHAKSCGQSAGILTAILHARSETIVTLDGDGQNDPADIPALLEAYQSARASKPIDMVAGYRQERHDNVVRKISSRMANGVRNFALKDNATDSGCGLKVFSRGAYLRLPYFDHMHRFMPALMLRGGYGVNYHPVNHRPRLKGTSKYNVSNRLFVGIVDLFGVMWLRRRHRRSEIAKELSD